jgi:hypothetical protein
VPIRYIFKHEESRVQERIMTAGFKYGLLLAVEMTVLFEIAPQPWGTVALFLVQAVQLVAYTAVTWRRTGLLIPTIGGSAASLASVLLAILYALGYTWQTLPAVWGVPLVLLIALVPVSVIASARVHRPGWNQWKRHMEGMGLLDVLLLRHIPTLRKRNA